MRDGTFSSFKAGTEAILASGKCYWMIIVMPNTGDVLSPLVFGTLAASSMSGYTVVPSALVDMSDIDQSIDMQKDVVAKAPAFDFTITNLVYTVDPTKILNRTVYVRLGYGETMSIATSDLMFTGYVSKIKPSEKNIQFYCSSSLNLESSIGEIAYSEIESGKIKPIIHGNWTDEYAMVPTVKTTNSANVLISGTYDRYSPTTVKMFTYKSGNKFEVAGSDYSRYYEVDGKAYTSLISSTIYSTTFYGTTVNSLMCFKIEVSSQMKTEVDTRLSDNKTKVMVAIKDAVFSVFGTTYQTIQTGVGTFTTKYYLYLMRMSGAINFPSTGGTASLLVNEDPGSITVVVNAKVKSINKLKQTGSFGPEQFAQKTKDGTLDIDVNAQYLNMELFDKVNDVFSFSFYPCYDEIDIDGLIYFAKLLINFEFSGAEASTNTYWSYSISKTASSGNTNYVRAVGATAYNENNESEGNVTGHFLDVGTPKSIQLKDFLTDGHYYTITRVKNTPSTLIGDSIKYNAFGVSLVVVCKLSDTSVYSSGYGLKALVDYSTVSANALIENPLSVIEDYFHRFIGGLTESWLDYDSLMDAFAARSDWKAATALYTGCELDG